jgi:hypothetical protein
MQNWEKFSPEEKKSIFDKLQQIYTSHSYPKGLKNPVSTDEFINIL